MDNELLILGGGLAGLTAAIHLSKIGFSVVVIEKHEYPRHKVCGEYISNEVVPYLEWLEFDITRLQPSRISQLQFSDRYGTSITARLPLGGFGISRFSFDTALYTKARELGCRFLFETVDSVQFEGELFTVLTSSGKILQSGIVIGAFGKRSSIDIQLKRDFIGKKSPWLAVKAHYSGAFNENFVGLHNFDGGYCGISKVENDVVNVCYLCDYKTFGRFRNIQDYQENVVRRNPNLNAFLANSEMIFEKPITISQISFENKKAVEDHILMIGDSAGMIHPLCGNGMAMAIHSAKIVAECIENFRLKNQSRAQLESDYSRQWKRHFSNRIRMGRILSQIFQNAKVTRILLRIFVKMPALLTFVVKQTHGKPIKV